ncbi:DODA-type extradiol aromatic ring-opening family dioxygenase [Gimesia panareensis]|nr:class III extradiol ring-cleavage dioxygenase [Gimesia panareensis]
MTQQIPQALFLSHGGGPMPLLGDPGHREMVACLQQIASQIPRPAAILMVSAHWEENLPTITAGEHPSLIYDYYGFPEESYQIQYPCPGDPSLAKEVERLLKQNDIEARLDETRGFDHGMFVPLKIMYPEADVPCVQMSLVNTLDPLQHIKTGQALQSLHQQNVLVVGSGFSFHNLDAFFSASTPESEKMNRSFEDWLVETCCSPDYSEAERMQRLTGWADVYGARFCHPREEHLLPLHVCYGVAQAPCRDYYEINILNKKASMFLW